MSTKIRVWFRGSGQAECVNASPETVSIRLPNSPDFIRVNPYTKFAGDFTRRSHDNLPAALPSDVEMGSVTYPPCVHRAGPEDIDALLLFVPQILAETQLLPVSHVKVERLIERSALQQGAVAGVIRGEEGIDASIGLIFTESETSDDPYIKAAWLGIHPSLRVAPDPSGRKPKADPADPRSHYARNLFTFAKWCHVGLERAAGHPILMQFDISTKTALGAKLGLYQRNTTQTGASFSFGSNGEFLGQADQVEAA